MHMHLPTYVVFPLDPPKEKVTKVAENCKMAFRQLERIPPTGLRATPRD
jgi:hypothetical protein